jgi:hypothetical protein
MREKFNPVDYTRARTRKIGVRIHGKDTSVTNGWKFIPTWLPEHWLGEIDSFPGPKTARRNNQYFR